MLVFLLSIAAVCTVFLFDVFIIILNNMCPTFSIISCEENWYYSEWDTKK